MHDDYLLAMHKEWIGYVQPVGLLVAPAALVHRAVIPDRNIGELQEQLDALTLVSEDSEPTVPDFPEFTTSFLGWEHSDLAGARDGRTLPDNMYVDLIEYGERLAPTYAVPAPGDGDDEWQMLIRVEAIGTDLDTAIGDDGKHWAASPHVRFERLLREKNIPVGLLTDLRSFRLVYAPKGETSGFATFKLDSMLDVAGRPMLSAFHMLLKGERLFGAPEQNLPALLAESRQYQETVSIQLAEQVLVALNELLRGFHAADVRTNRTTVVDLVRNEPDHLYNGLLTSLMRLVFVLYAEDRDLFPRQEVWEQNYSLGGLFERLRNDAALYPDTMDDRYGAWAQLIALWRLMYFGGRHADLRLTARRGQLFDPNRFLFLEGRTADDAVSIPAVSDGVVWRILQSLMMLDSDRLSYRTLDVEQIGSVYQSVMGFTIELTTGTSVAIRTAKPGGAAATVDLDELLAVAPAKRAESVRHETDRKLTPKQAEAAKIAETILELESGLSAIIDQRITPKALPRGVPVLQPTQARRRTGSHYTPRLLTAPIVSEALRPIFERLGSDATPEQILDLKVLDPALGSGAFLVEACRQISEKLVEAWEHHSSAPVFPADEDALLYARRLVAQRCLYGVDRNPMATDLAKLSLWLVTLAREHEFTFVDHAIRHGDALVGLSEDQILRLNWTSEGEDTFAAAGVRAQLTEAMRRRDEIRSAHDGASDEKLQQILKVATESINEVSIIGDAIVGAFFAGSNSKARELARRRVTALLDFRGAGWQKKLAAGPEELHQSRGMPDTFHWYLEFPEVFLRANGGFDVVVGNPPYMGGAKISSVLGMSYFEWLRTIHPGAKHQCDLAAHFFRRCFGLLRENGCLGFVATNTISQGDTREGGLQHIVKSGGTIFSAVKRHRWSGEAAVTVSVVHLVKGPALRSPILNGEPVHAISCYLVAGTMNDTPRRLANVPYYSKGTQLYGQGFLFDDSDARATRLATMDAILSFRPDLASRIIPFIGGEEINSMAVPTPTSYAIYLSDIQFENDLHKYEELAQIVREKVKPERDRLGSNPNNIPLKKKWWAYQAHRPELYARIKTKTRILCQAETSKHLAMTFLPTNLMFNKSVIVIDTDSFADFCLLQCRIHEVWARAFGSSLEDRLRYTSSDILGTFPMAQSDAMRDMGEKYFGFRSRLMYSKKIGLTDLYNQFNDPIVSSPEIVELRELHNQLDRETLANYGWSDIVTISEFEPEWVDGDEVGPVRYRWPEAVRDQVLARLLDLNGQRAAEEARLGMSGLTVAGALNSETLEIEEA